MCGIAGFYNIAASQPQDELENILRRMTDSIRHRGPDDSGAWVDPRSGIALGFRRLAILDLSPTGHQPMTSADGRYIIIFNGEIYNYGSLRDELLGLGHIFQGSSDTEVMLAAVRQWGLQTAVQRFNGMFAFALWDGEGRTLHLVRDRLGVKPLYYGWLENTLVFGSELKALRAHPAFRQDIDRNALTLYLRHNYIPAPFTIYQGIHKLAPGHILTIRPGSEAGDERIESYWAPRTAVEKGITNPFKGDESAALEVLDGLLTRSIGLRMIADVPLGAFLSGGVDSSTVVALMQKQSSRPVRTFTIGFHETGFNEAEHALAVAKHLGTDHTELYVTPEEARAVIPRLPTLYDEPFADSSQIPTFLVSELARRHVTVSLSGDGGDELFGGYNRYSWATRIWGAVSWMPVSWRRATAHGLTALSPKQWSKLLWPTRLPNPGDKIHKLSEILTTPVREALYLDLISHWKQPASLVIDAQEPLTAVTDPLRWMNTSTFAERMMSLDLVTYLPDDILAKVDRASMGVSLEARTPFIDDHEVVEFAWKLPLRMKIRSGQGKWILRQLLYRYVPRKLIERPKMGFGVPIDSWLRGPLQPWAEDLLAESRLRREGFFQPEPIRQKWEEHLSGRRNWQYYLWDILMFQAWLAENRG
jgi:asparagine synthase (glutamine-hydrolysing)